MRQKKYYFQSLKIVIIIRQIKIRTRATVETKPQTSACTRRTRGARRALTRVVVARFESLAGDVVAVAVVVVVAVEVVVNAVGEVVDVDRVDDDDDDDDDGDNVVVVIEVVVVVVVVAGAVVVDESRDAATAAATSSTSTSSSRWRNFDSRSRKQCSSHEPCTATKRAYDTTLHARS